MEKATTPKRYNLKLSVDPNKPSVPLLRCARCGSMIINVISRRKYFIRSVTCLVFAVLCCWEFVGLKAETEIDPVVIMGLIGCVPLSCLSLIFGLYFFIKGALTKETSYKCQHCKNTNFKNILNN